MNSCFFFERASMDVPIRLSAFPPISTLLSIRFMTFTVSPSASEVGGFVPYEGKVFEAGSYPDKAFSIGEEELATTIAGFQGVDLDLEHSPFHDLLGHRLGRLEHIWLSGREAFGRLAVPRWLHDLCGGRLQTSLTFDKNKKIIGCALTLNPRIPDAQVVAAFAAFHQPTKENFMRPLKDRLRALFGKAPGAVAQAGIDPAELDQVEFIEPTPTIDPAIQQQLSEFKATNDRLISGQLQTHATLFADETIRSAKAVPSQRDALISLYRSAAMADGQGTVRFSEAGQVEEGPNLSALRTLFAQAVPHTLFHTQIQNGDPNGEAEGPDPRMIDRLRQATSLGRQTIQKEAK